MNAPLPELDADGQLPLLLSQWIEIPVDSMAGAQGVESPGSQWMRSSLARSQRGLSLVADLDAVVYQ